MAPTWLCCLWGRRPASGVGPPDRSTGLQMVLTHHLIGELKVVVRAWRPWLCVSCIRDTRALFDVCLIDRYGRELGRWVFYTTGVYEGLPAESPMLARGLRVGDCPFRYRQQKRKCTNGNRLLYLGIGTIERPHIVD